MTNQLETAKEWLSDLNKIIDKTDNEHTKQKRDVLEWLVEEVEELKKENNDLHREVGKHASQVFDIANASFETGERAKQLINKMLLKGETK